MLFSCLGPSALSFLRHHPAYAGIPPGNSAPHMVWNYRRLELERSLETSRSSECWGGKSSWGLIALHSGSHRPVTLNFKEILLPGLINQIASSWCHLQIAGPAEYASVGEPQLSSLPFIHSFIHQILLCACNWVRHRTRHLEYISEYTRSRLCLQGADSLAEEKILNNKHEK